MRATILTVICATLAACVFGAEKKPAPKKTSLTEAELRTIAKASPNVKDAGTLYSVGMATNNVEQRQEYLQASAACLLACGKNEIYKKHIKGKLGNVATFEESLKEKCKKCSGAGKKDSRCNVCSGKGRCSFCKGSGKTVSVGFDRPNGWKACHKCKGSGKCQKCGGGGSTKEKCATCGGTGKTFHESVAERVFRDTCMAIANGMVAETKTKAEAEKHERKRIADEKSANVETDERNIKIKAAITLPPGTPSELLLKYSEQGETAYVEAVLEQNPTLDVNRPRATGNKTALYLACENGFSDIVELLLKKNADATICDSIRQGFNVQCYSPFTIAAKNGHRSVCQILLASGKVDIESRDTENRTALYAAAANNQASVVQFLCESKAKVNIHGRGGFTPLTVAAFDGHVEVIKTLLKYGRELDLEMRDKGTFNATPLYHAAFKNHPEVVEVLCKAKAKVNIHESSGRGNTPLTAAASQGYVEVVKSLLEYGDGLNLEMKDGLMSYTPLYFAASNNHLEIVEILCKAGADVNAICGVLRETPLGSARRRGYAEVIRILEHYK